MSTRTASPLSASRARVGLVALLAAVVTLIAVTAGAAGPPAPAEERAAAEALERAEALFAAGVMDQALAAYDLIPRAASIGPYARYKGAWCLFNLERYVDALGRFHELVVAGRGQAAPPARALAREAAKDAALVYPRVGVPSKALAFFEAMSPDGYLELTERVADVYAESGHPEEADAVLAVLTEAVRGRPALAAEVHRVARYHRIRLEGAWRLGDRGRLATLAKEIPARWAEARRGRADSLTDEHGRLRALVVEILRETSREAETRAARDVLRSRYDAVAEPYLAAFPEDAEALPAPPG